MASRLQRLCTYLAEDPTNAVLLADACDAAISAGRHELAEEFLGAARDLSVGGADWTFRKARLCIARRHLPEAAALLEQLRTDLGEHAVLAHDTAYVRLLQGDAAGALALLEPWMERIAATPEVAREQRAALQVLWLRASHRQGLLEPAWAWAQRERAEGRLEAAASGVASLIAVDVDDMDAARAMADAALSVDARQVEALVARGSVALVNGDAAGATVFLERALLSNPDDGRTWSALGFASLLQRDLLRATLQLERALQAMPRHVESWQALGWTRLLLGDRSGALAAFREGLGCDPDSAESHAAMAIALLFCGDKEEASRHLHTATQLDPECGIARQARALIAGEPGDIAKLDAAARQVLAQWTRRP